MSASFEIQKSIFTVLNNGLVVPVYDNVPDNALMPYVVIGDDTLIDFDTDGKTGFEVTVTIHAWSNYRGRAQVKGLLGEIYFLLHRKDYVIIGYTLIGSDCEFEETILESDGVTRHGIQRFRLFLIKES
jgi:hypothetical protein